MGWGHSNNSQSKRSEYVWRGVVLYELQEASLASKSRVVDTVSTCCILMK